MLPSRDLGSFYAVNLINLASQSIHDVQQIVHAQEIYENMRKTDRDEGGYKKL
jgi:hypothetical protein